MVIMVVVNSDSVSMVVVNLALRLPLSGVLAIKFFINAASSRGPSWCTMSSAAPPAVVPARSLHAFWHRYLDTWLQA